MGAAAAEAPLASGEENVSVERSPSGHRRTYRYDRFNDLYIQALKQKLNHEKVMGLNMDEECTFRPKLYKRIGNKKVLRSYKSAEKDLGQPNLDLRQIQSTAHNEQEPGLLIKAATERSLYASVEQTPGVWERMNQRIIDFGEKQKKRENPEKYDLIPTTDKTTGQQLFRPRLQTKPNSDYRSSGALTSRDNCSRSVSASNWDRLYQNAQLMQQKKKMQIDMYREEQRLQFLDRSQYQTINKSVKLVDSRMRTKLGEIFDMFDANGNGKISADEIELDLVSAEILAIFKPLLVEMETFDEDLDREEFIESGLTLLEKLDISSKNTVLQLGRSKIHKSQAHFEKDNRLKVNPLAALCAMQYTVIKKTIRSKIAI